MPTVTQLYHVKAGVQVELDAAIGDGQAGGISAFLGSTFVGHGELELHKTLPPGDQLVGKVLVISATAVDIQPDTDHVSVGIKLRGGFPSMLPIVQGAQATTGGAVAFLTVVSFVGGAP